MRVLGIDLVCIYLFMQYTSKKDGYAVSRLVEKAVADAEASGATVLSLGLLNQASSKIQHLLQCATAFTSLTVAFTAGLQCEVQRVGVGCGTAAEP